MLNMIGIISIFIWMYKKSSGLAGFVVCLFSIWNIIKKFVTYLLFRSIMFCVWHFRGCSTIIPRLCIGCCFFTRRLHSVPLPVGFTDNLVIAYYLKTLIACVYGLIVKMSGNLDQITYPEKLDKILNEYCTYQKCGYKI